jgi:hypothetical protein
VLCGPIIVANAWYAVRATGSWDLDVLSLPAMLAGALLVGYGFSRVRAGTVLAPVLFLALNVSIQQAAFQFGKSSVLDLCETTVRYSTDDSDFLRLWSDQSLRAGLTCQVHDFQLSSYWEVGVYSAGKRVGYMEVSRPGLLEPLKVLTLVPTVA